MNMLAINATGQKARLWYVHRAWRIQTHRIVKLARKQVRLFIKSRHLAREYAMVVHCIYNPALQASHQQRMRRMILSSNSTEKRAIKMQSFPNTVRCAALRTRRSVWTPTRKHMILHSIAGGKCGWYPMVLPSCSTVRKRATTPSTATLW